MDVHSLHRQEPHSPTVCNPLSNVRPVISHERTLGFLWSGLPNPQTLQVPVPDPHLRLRLPDLLQTPPVPAPDEKDTHGRTSATGTEWTDARRRGTSETRPHRTGRETPTRVVGT